MMIEILAAMAGLAVGGVGVAHRLREPGESLLSAVRRALSGPRPTRPK